MQLPRSVGVTLDRSHTYRKDTENVHDKLEVTLQHDYIFSKMTASHGSEANPTVAPREMKLRFWYLLLCVDFYYTMSRFFCKLHRDVNRVNESRERFRDTSKHK